MPKSDKIRFMLLAWIDSEAVNEEKDTKYSRNFQILPYPKIDYGVDEKAIVQRCGPYVLCRF